MFVLSVDTWKTFIMDRPDECSGDVISGTQLLEIVRLPQELLTMDGGSYLSCNVVPEYGQNAICGSLI